MLSRRRFCAALALSAMPLVAGASVPAFSVTDVLGRKTSFSKAPERIVVANYLIPFLTVGGKSALSKLIAFSRDGWADVRVAEAQRFTKAYPVLDTLPSIGGYHDNILNTEAILSLKPDALIVGITQFHENAQRLSLLEKVGVAIIVLDYHALRMENHLLSTAVLGKLLKAEARSEKLNARYQSVIETVQKRIATVPAAQKQKKVYLECGNLGIAAFGNSYNKQFLWGGILEALGANNIARDMSAPYAPLSREYVLSQKPDIIVMAGSIWLNAAQNDQMQMGLAVSPIEAQKRLLGFASRPMWQALPAVREKQMYAVDHGSIRTPIDYIYTLYLAQILYPGVLDDFNVEREIDDFYRTYLPELDASGTYTLKLK